MPDTLIAVVRDRGAWNLANAFLKPVADHDIMAGSTKRLIEHFAKLRDFYGTSQIRTATAASVSGQISDTKGMDVVTSVDDFATAVLVDTGA